MLKAKIDPETKDILCPTCSESKFVIFRRDRLEETAKEGYLNHCKCGCGQIFIYIVDQRGNVVVE